MTCLSSGPREVNYDANHKDDHILTDWFLTQTPIPGPSTRSLDRGLQPSGTMNISCACATKSTTANISREFDALLRDNLKNGDS